MENVEKNILGELNSVSTTAGYVDLMVAAQIINSETLYRQVLQSLISSTPQPDLAQSRRIGVEATYSILEAKITNENAALVEALAEAKAQLATAEASRGRCNHSLYCHICKSFRN
jgi:hypothetical protein